MTQSIHRRSLAFGVGATLLALGLMSQVSVTSSAAPRLSALQSGLSPGWPPHASRMVQLDHRSNPVPPISPGSVAVVYSVPVDKWLVITDTTLSTSNSDTTVCENLAGVHTYRFNADSLITSAPLGATFAPGTDVVIKNENGTSTVSVSSYAFVGYLVDG